LGFIWSAFSQYLACNWLTFGLHFDPHFGCIGLHLTCIWPASGLHQRATISLHLLYIFRAFACNCLHMAFMDGQHLA
jgi:hypothetical protein